MSATLSPRSRDRQKAPGVPPPGRLVLQPVSALSGIGGGAPHCVADWMRAYLMRPHPDLGRSGAVCPYTPTSAKADLALVGASKARTEDEILAVMREAVSAFDEMACPEPLRDFRCVLVGFPACEGQAGRALLKQVQNRLRPESTRRGKMIGLCEPNAEDRGLINPDFRPLRSPVPLLAIRSLVEADAPFVLRNPRLLPIYLWRFPRRGPARLLRCWLR